MDSAIYQSDKQLAQENMLRQVLAEVTPLMSEGQVATYIPALASVSRRNLGIATAGCDGVDASAGNANVRFSIQSISKMFSLTLGLSLGRGEEIWQRIGREPSGDPFNSIVLLEREMGIPRNPFINPGAIVVADVLCSALSSDPVSEITQLLSDLSGAQISINPKVASSEKDTGYKNASLANLLKSYGNLNNEVERVLDVYFRLCSIEMSAVELASAARFLASDGVDPISGRNIVSPLDARRINSLMLMAGTYDAAGAFAFEIGIPCKSGVGGGIVGVVPDAATVCVWSPGLDRTGNSLAGRAALAGFIGRSGLSVF